MVMLLLSLNSSSSWSGRGTDPPASSQSRSRARVFRGLVPCKNPDQGIRSRSLSASLVRNSYDRFYLQISQSSNDWWCHLTVEKPGEKKAEQPILTRLVLLTD